MKFGSFLDNKISKQVKYSYHRRGIDEFYPPDVVKEQVDCCIYTAENGNLFYDKEVAWRDNVVLQNSIDVKFDLDGKCFVDNIEILQGDGSAIDSIEAFTVSNGKYIKIASYNSETNKLIESRHIIVNVGYYCENIVLRLNADCMPVAIKKLDIWGAWDMENIVYPTPADVCYKNKSFPLNNLKKIKANTENEIFAAKYLCEKLKEKTDFCPEISNSEGNIVFVTEEFSAKDSYTLDINDNHCTITAPNRLCLLFAIDAMLQLTDGNSIKCCHIEDEAFMELRGIHIALPSRNQIPFLKSIVKNVFVPMRYNTVFLQISAAMRYDKYPQINDAWLEACEMYEKGQWPIPAHYGFVGRDILEKSEVRDLCEYFESFGIEVIPEVQAYSHSQYVTMAYPHLAEKAPSENEDGDIDFNSKDERPDTFYYHTLCPLHEDYYTVIFNIIDEVLEVVKPKRFVHMGHDEIYEVGKCSKCNKVSRSDLFANEVTKLNDYIKSKNLNMMIWSDMLQDMEYSTMAAINKVPEDIVMLDFVWYFHLDEDIEDRLLSHGFKVIMGNMYSSHYPRFETRSHKDGMIGAQVSTWVDCTEYSYGFYGKMFDFVYSAECMWNGQYDSKYRITYNEIIKPILSDIRIKTGNLKVDGEKIILNICGEKENIPFDIRGIVNYDTALSANCCCRANEVVVDSFAEIISFVHATDKGSHKRFFHGPIKIGEYIICYEDGTEFTKDICYAENIYKYLSPYGDKISSPFFRHHGYVGTYLTIPQCGKTYNGKDYTLGKYSIKNPYPEKKIRAVKINHSGNTDAEILIFEMSIEKGM